MALMQQSPAQHQSSAPLHRLEAEPATALRWSLDEESSSESEVELVVPQKGYRLVEYASDFGAAAWPPEHWPMQWHSWNPWRFPQVPGPLPHLVTSERRTVVLSHLEPDADYSTEVAEMVRDEVGQAEEEVPALPVALAASSSCPDEVVAGPSNPLPPDDFRAHREFLKWVAMNLGLEVEELKESTHSVIDILALAAPSEVGAS